MKDDMITVLYIQTGKEPQVIQIEHVLKEMQRLVGETISSFRPFDDNSVLIVNDNGKTDGLPLNHAVYDKNGELIDIIAGNFFICYAAPDSSEFSSLPDELIRKYFELFKTPQTFVKIGNELVIISADDQQ